MPSSGTFSIGTNSRDYSTISAWEADTDVSLTGDVVGECYNDSVFDEQATVAGASTTASASRTLTVAEGEKHNGTAGTGARINYSSPTDGETYLNCVETYLLVEWLELTAANTARNTDQTTGVRISGDQAVCRQMIVHDLDTNEKTDFRSFYGIAVGFGSNTEVTVANCIVYDIFGAQQTSVGIVGNKFSSSGWTINILNCTVWNISDPSSQSVGVRDAGQSDPTNTIVVKNTVVMNTDASNFSLGGAAGTVTTENNASADGTADDDGGTGHLINQTDTDWFVDLTDGSEDFHLQSTANGVDAGTDLGDVPAKIDIDGGDRHAEGVTWDIGADEEELDGPPRPARVIQSIGRSVPSLGRALTRGV